MTPRTAVSSRPPGDAVRGEGTPGYRYDIDGLRTLAIVLVVIYHVWLGRVSGGVDVFLMVSAFFLTASLTRRAERGPIALGPFWARRFGSLLPAAAVTLLGVLALGLAFSPATQWPRLWRETWSSLFFVENWTLAASQVDYYARDAVSTSPLQHFWSLSVQGQVFVLWPVLIGLVALLLRRHRDAIRPALIALFSVIFAASLAFSVIETSAQQDFAYFDTRARLWEFAAGSLVALLLPSIRIPRWARIVLGWAGIAGIVLCGIVLDVQQGFPGFLALWPVLCTAAVIVGGAEAVPGSPTRVLSSRPLAALSGDAYALYLVHWPLLVTWMVVTKESSPGPVWGAAIILASFLLARLLARGVQRPLRRISADGRPARRQLIIATASIVAVAAASGGWQLYQSRQTASVEALAQGADDAVSVESGGTPLLPLPTELDEEWVDFGTSCQGAFTPAATVLDGTCMQTWDAATADRRILVIGDSHAQQLSAPLLEAADDDGIGIVALLKGGCTAGLTEESRSLTDASCEPWITAALDYATALSPSAVYLVATRADAEEPERLLNGIDQSIGRLQQAGIPVIAVRDNPRFTVDMYDCALNSDTSCSVPRSAVLADENPALALNDVTLVDFTPELCPDDVCESTIDQVALYIDDNHLSWTFGRTLTPIVDDTLRASGLVTSRARHAEGDSPE